MAMTEVMMKLLGKMVSLMKMQTVIYDLCCMSFTCPLKLNINYVFMREQAK